MAKKQNFYPEEIKREVIRLKLTGDYTNRELMDRFGIKNKRQIKNWVDWFRNGEEHRLGQGTGKQYKYGHGHEELSEVEKLKKKVAYYEMKEELLGKYQEIERKWYRKYSSTL